MRRIVAYTTFFVSVALLLTALLSIAATNAYITLVNTRQADDMNLFLAYRGMNLEAQGVVVYDATHNKILFGLHPYTPLPLASVSKVMTALVGRNILSKDTPIIIDPASRTSAPDYDLHLHDTWNAKDLIQYSLVKCQGGKLTIDIISRVIQRGCHSSSPVKNKFQ